MNLIIGRIHFPVTTLGFGRRLVIWTQGCHIRCPGCVNRDTWNSSAGTPISPMDLLDACSGILEQADGLTVSGGEPFEQPEALGELLAGFRERHSGDILVFSGFERADLLSHRIIHEGLIDVLVSGPYRADLPQTLTLRGSDNQRVDPLTDLAKERYSADIDTRPWEPGKRQIDIFPSGGKFHFAGIPKPGWGESFRDLMALRGYDCQTSDQRPRERSHIQI